MKLSQWRKLGAKACLYTGLCVGGVMMPGAVHGQSNAPAALINIDFDSTSISSEVGFAATGQTSGDFWNLVNPTANGAASNLLYADKSASGVGISVTNAPGLYGNGVIADLMYNGYLYPYDGGNIGIGVTNLAAGTYDIYVYGHGPADSGNSTYTLGLGGTSYGSLTTAQSGWNTAVWQEGVQYVVFRGVNVTNPAQNLSLVVSPAASSYAIIAGIQIATSTPVVPAPPTIVSQPASQTVFAGANVTFGVSVSGSSPFDYQWTFNGTNIVGATASVLSLTNVQSSAAGNYAVSVSNLLGSTVSSNALLTVNPPVAPVITNQPHSATVPVGASVNFSVTATGTAPLTYQWRFQGSNLFGATKSSLSLVSVQATNAGNYSVVVANSAGSVVSSNALLTVTGTAPVIVSQPQSRTVGVGSTTSFSALASGSPILAYQWKFNGSNMAGATRSFLTLTNVQTNNAGIYAVVVTNAFGLATSTNATLIVTSAVPVLPAIVSQPQSISVAVGGGANFNVLATGTAPLAYQWTFNGSNIVGATRASLTFSNAQPSNAGVYAVSVSNVAGSVTSSNATLTVVGVAPMIVSQPVDVNAIQGANVSFSVQASGSQPMNYQWSLNGSTLPGATGSSLVLNNVQTNAAGNYTVSVTNAYGSVDSSNAVLVVTVPQPHATPLQLINVDFAAGTVSGEVGLAATGQTANDFWNLYSRDDGNGGYRSFGGVGNLKFADGTVSTAGLTVANAPGAWGNGVSDVMYQDYLYPFDGGNITVMVTNLDAGTYEIYLYGHAPSNDGNSTYTLTVGGVSYGSLTTSPTGWNSTVWQEGAQYVVFRNVVITSTGTPVQVVVSPSASSFAIIAGMQLALVTAPTPAAPSIVSQPQDKTVTAGNSATFNVSVAGTAPLSYQWTFNGGNIPGATEASLVLNNVTTNNAGIYAVTVSNALGSAISSNATLTVDTAAEVLRLVNIDFDAGTTSSKTGFAATGQTSSDFWNLYSRDDSHGGYRTIGGLSNLEFADGSISQAGLTIANAPGAWGNGVPDGMYQGYLYPFNGGNIILDVTNLDVGTYDIYLYGHGLGDDGNSTYTLDVNGAAYGSLTTAQGGWNSTVWQEGVQYVVFRGVVVTNAAADVKVVVSPQASSFAVIAGMQIAQVHAPTPTAPVITSQPSSQTVSAGANVVFNVGVTGTSPLSFQWQYNGSNITGATKAALSLSSVQLSSAGNYSVTVANGAGSATSSNAVLTVTPFNHVPVADSQNIALDQNSSVAITLTGVDADGDALSYSLVSVPAHGTLTGIAPNLVYTPISNYAGSDSFTFKVNDGSVDSTPGSVSIVIRQDGLKPLINVDFDAGNVSAKVGFAATGQNSNDFWNLYSRDDGHGGYLTMGGIKNLKFADGSVSGTGLTVANAPGAWGNGVSDAMYQGYLYPFNGGNIAVNVTNLNPGTYDIYLYGHAPANDGNSTYQLNVGNASYGSLTTAQAGWNSASWQEGVQYVAFRNVVVSNPGDQVQITVLPGASGYALIAGMQIAGLTATTNDPPINHPPIGNDQNVSVVANGSVAMTLSGSDVNNNTLTYSLISLPAHGTLTGIAPNLVYQPDTNYTGADNFTFKVNDGQVDSAPATVSISVFEAEGGSIIDIDFGAGTSGGKTGFAAIGQTPNDFWNYYTRDDGQGGWLTLGAVSNLKFVDGSLSGAGVIVANAPGYWTAGSSDPMFDGYIYPLDGGNASVVATNLAVGEYDFYVYGVDGQYELTANGYSYGVKATTNAFIVNPVNWQEGVQYVVFRGVQITNASQSTSLTIRPGVTGYALISGLQIVRIGTNNVEVPPAGTGNTNTPTAKVQGSGIFLPGSTNQFVISANGSNAVVMLDGSLSTDPANASLEYSWVADGVPFANGVLTTNLFGLGEHNVTLTVTNGMATGTAGITLEVLGPVDGLDQLIVAVVDSGLNIKVKRPLIEILDNIILPPIPGGSNEPQWSELEVFQSKVLDNVAPIDPALAETFIKFSQEILDAVNTP
jgi:Bacterial Ig domain/Immunoglobulin domain/Immunoglobulin I-set domain